MTVILCVEETWYAIQDLHMLNNLHSKFRGSGVSTTDYNEKLLSGHPPGGLLYFGINGLTQLSR